MSEEILTQKFNEWIDELGKVEQRISIFEHVRDIPYKLITELYNPKVAHEGILRYNGGSCTPKHFLLGYMLEKLGIPIRYTTFPFSWNAPDVQYPVDLRRMAEQLPTEYHLACRAFIDGRWVLVDATWDIPLKRAGFPVNESWDGVSDTLNAVMPLEEIEHQDIWERSRFTDEHRGRYTPQEIEIRNSFIGGFNAWIEQVRSSD